MKTKIALIIVLILAITLIFTACNLFKKDVTYTVTLDANEGTLSGESVLTVPEQSMVDLPSPKREGYIFLGWYIGEGANEAKFASNDVVTSNITLKAKWMSEEAVNGGVKIEVHTVTLNANGGTISGDSIINAQTYCTLNLPTPTLTGYVFLGWYTGEGANEALFTSGSLVTRDLTLTAKWAKEEHTVTFIDYYGRPIAREVVKYGEAANAPVVPRIAEEKLRFDAWDKDISAITSDIEVKALYVTDAYSINYVTNNTQTIPPTSYFFDETPKAPPSPGLGGHHFIGWYLDEAFTTEYLFDAPLTSDITLYAYFNESIPIATLDELMSIEQYSANTYFLKNDIDCGGAVITSSILDFAGTLDGEGRKIYNFVYQPTSAANIGLFATNGGTIKNITFDNFSYSITNQNTNSKASFLVGTNSGTIENVHITNATLSYIHVSTGGSDYRGTYTYSSTYGNITGENKGSVIGCSVTNSTIYLEVFTSSWYDSGNAVAHLDCSTLVGLNNGTIENSNVDVTTTLYNRNNGTASYSGNYSYMYFGGITSINNGVISECDVVFDMTASATANRTRRAYIGGLVRTNTSTIDNSSVNATLSCTGGYEELSLGGFVENNEGTINNCYTAFDISNVDSNAIIGGFSSYNRGGIYKCYAAGKMSTADATIGKGGFTGYNNGSINSSFASVNIIATNATNYGPFIGRADTGSYVTNSYYNLKSTFVTNGEPQVFGDTYAEVTDPLNLADREFFIGTLDWSEDIWSFDENKFNHPVLK